MESKSKKTQKNYMAELKGFFRWMLNKKTIPQMPEFIPIRYTPKINAHWYPKEELWVVVHSLFTLKKTNKIRKVWLGWEDPNPAPMPKTVLFTSACSIKNLLCTVCAQITTLEEG